MLKTFSNEDFEITHISDSHRTGLNPNTRGIKRIIDGLLDLFETYRDVKCAIKTNEFVIMHTTTSGAKGSLRDYVLAKLCKKMVSRQ